MKWRSSFSGLDPWGLLASFALPRPTLALARYNDTARFKKHGELLLPIHRSVSTFPQGTVAASAPSGMVVMTGQVVNFVSTGATARAGIRFNSDGSIDEQGPGATTFNQVDVGEWWSEEPETGIGSNYDVVSLSASASGTWSQSAAADDTWIQISSDRLWNVLVVAKSAPNVNSATRTFSIRPTGGGSTLDSGLYSCTIEN